MFATVDEGSVKISGAATFSESASGILGHLACRALTDRAYETKKKGAKEIEDVVRFVQEREIGVAREKTSAIINVLVSEFLTSSNSDFRVGGFVGIVGVARGLGGNTKYYLAKMVCPVIQQFKESSELNVRYYAAECLFNLCLIAPADVVVLVGDLVDILFAMWRDPEANLRRAAQHLDSTLLNLAMKYGTESQLELVANLVVAEMQTNSAIHLVPWFRFVLKCSEKYRMRYELGSAICSLISLVQGKSSTDKWIEDTLVAAAVMVRSGQVEQSCGWEVRFGETLAVLIKERRVSIQKMAMVCLDTMVEVADEELSVNCLGLVVMLSMTMVAHLVDLDDLPRLQAVTNRLQRLVEKVDDLSAVAASAGDILNTADCENMKNLFAIEFALEWILVVASKIKFLPSSACLEAIVVITTHECLRLRKLATDCIVNLCRVSREFREGLVISTIARVTKSTSLSQARAMLELIDSLTQTMSTSEILELPKLFPGTNFLERRLYFHVFLMAELICPESRFEDINELGGFFKGFPLLESLVTELLGARQRKGVNIIMDEKSGRRGYPVADLTMLIGYMELGSLYRQLDVYGGRYWCIVDRIWPAIQRILPVDTPVARILGLRCSSFRPPYEDKPTLSTDFVDLFVSDDDLPTLEEDLNYRRVIGEILLPLVRSSAEDRFALPSPLSDGWVREVLGCEGNTTSPEFVSSAKKLRCSEMSVDTKANNSPAHNEESTPSSSPGVESSDLSTLMAKVQDRSVDDSKETLAKI